MEKDFIGSELMMKSGDMNPVSLGAINSKVVSKGSLAFNKGLHLILESDRSLLPKKHLLVLFVQTEDQIFVGGLDIIDLFTESLTKKGFSSLAKEQIKLKSRDEKDGAIISAKFRIRIKSIPPQQAKRNVDSSIAFRATDFYQTNQQYRKLYTDLKAQINYLESKVGKLTNQEYNDNIPTTYSTNINSRKVFRTKPSPTLGLERKKEFIPDEAFFSDEEKSDNENTNDEQHDYSDNLQCEEGANEIVEELAFSMEDDQ